MNVEMHVEIVGVLLLGLGYLALLFGCGFAVERGWVPVRITRHPIVYTLALGVYASAWAIYGSVEMAAHAGFGFLATTWAQRAPSCSPLCYWCPSSASPAPIN